MVFSHNQYTTKIIKQTLDPEWNFELDINIHPGRLPALINITVWDEDFLGRDFLGRNNGGSADGMARHYGDPENQTAWYTLNKRTEKNNVSGEICLRFGFMEKAIRPCEEYMKAWMS
ncbi:hypothetical protein BCR42DRAFT_458568 [Absidia repens]|uniref:C2 domain-containing protein n=1 Tax=Absidia repens TaxID=90262 RepID=A0A1X2IVC8_9FUNG|nr:hypothetical protein BCR42DRAFT_458568 [Absidia repens]